MNPTSPRLRRARVLAIDPGIGRLGIAVLEKDGLLYSECFKTSSKKSQGERLLSLSEKIEEIIKKWHPQSLAIETLFFNQNISSGIRVAEARGVAILESARNGLVVYEYSPQSAKIAVTSYGKASKSDMQRMIERLITLPPREKKRLDEELDAIALGITHLASHRN